MDSENISFEELRLIVEDIHNKHPNYNQTKIANLIFIERRLSLNSQRILEILNEIKEKKIHNNQYPDTKDYCIIKKHEFPIFTNNDPNEKDIEYSLIFKEVSILNVQFSIRAQHILGNLLVKNVHDLLLTRNKDIQNSRNCGAKTIKEIFYKTLSFLANFNNDKFLKERKKKEVPFEVIVNRFYTLDSLLTFPIFNNTAYDSESLVLHSSYCGSYKLKDIPFDQRTLNAFSRLKISTVKELLFYPKSVILKTLSSGKKTIENIQNQLIYFYKTIHTDNFLFDNFHDMLEKVLNNKKENLEIFIERLSSVGIDSTLEAIGKRHNLTRERIRQIVNRIEESLKLPFIYMQINEFFEALDIVIDQYILATDARNIINDLTYLLDWNEILSPEVVFNFCGINERYKTDKDNLLIFSKSKKCTHCNRFVEFIENFFKSNSKITLFDLNSKFTNICKDSCKSFAENKMIDNQCIIWLIDKNDNLSSLCVYDEEDNCYYSMTAWEEKNKPKSIRLLRILEQQIEPLHVNEFTEIVNNQLGTVYTPNQVSNLILNSDGAYLWDRGTVFAKSNFNFPSEFIGSLIDDVINLLEYEKLPVLYIHGLFKKYEDVCHKSNIPNPIALYSLFREKNDSRLNLVKYPDIYLNSVNSGRSNITNEIVNFLKLKDGSYDYVEMREYFLNTLNAADYIFQNALADCDKIEKIDSIVRIIDEHSPKSTQQTKPVEDHFVIDYLELINKKDIDLSLVEFKIVKELIKRKGSLTFLRANIFSKRQGFDFNSSIFSLNSKFYNLFGKELIIKDEREEIWEINYHYNNIDNWEKDTIEMKKNDSTKSCEDETSDSISDEDLEKLNHLLDSSVTLYEIYWFQSLLYIIKNNIFEESFTKMAILMCSFAWKDVLVFRFSYPKLDQIPKIIQQMYIESDLSKNSNFIEVKDYLTKNQNLFIDQLKNLTLYVPYRFLSIYVNNMEAMNESEKNICIQEASQKQCLIYSIKEYSILVNNQWKNVILRKINEFNKLIDNRKAKLNV